MDNDRSGEADHRDRANAIVSHMMAHDGFSRWLGITVERVAPGEAVLKMTVRAEMLNGFGSAHGGIQYALADSALAFASNSRGRKAVALNNSISYPAPVRAGDELVATATEVSLGNTIGYYDVVITNHHQRVVALFRGSVFRVQEEWSI
jgi:acyl-CoA thioesterase